MCPILRLESPRYLHPSLNEAFPFPLLPLFGYAKVPCIFTQGLSRIPLGFQYTFSINCRFVKHIGQSKTKESEEENAIEEDAWDESCCDFGGQLAAHQSR